MGTRASDGKDYSKRSRMMEAGLVIAFMASFGAIWNYIEHRFIKNKPQ